MHKVVVARYLFPTSNIFKGDFLVVDILYIGSFIKPLNGLVGSYEKFDLEFIRRIIPCCFLRKFLHLCLLVLLGNKICMSLLDLVLKERLIFL